MKLTSREAGILLTFALANRDCDVDSVGRYESQWFVDATEQMVRRDWNRIIAKLLGIKRGKNECKTKDRKEKKKPSQKTRRLPGSAQNARR